MTWPKGRPFSAEHRAKLSDAGRCRPHPPMSEAARAKISEAQRRREHGPLSVEHRAAISRGQVGRQQSAETRAKISARMKAAWQQPGHKNKTHTEAARAKRSASVRKYRTGKRMSPEQREAMRRRQVAKWQSYTPEEWEARTAKLRPKKPRYFDTSIERAVCAVLLELGEVYKHNHRLGRYQVDVFLPERALVIECDGTYWHSKPEQIAKDREKDTWLRERGYRVVRLAEAEIRVDARSLVLQALPCEAGPVG